MPPDTKTKLISIHTLNLSLFGPPYKTKSIPIPQTEIKSISTTHITTKSIYCQH